MQRSMVLLLMVCIGLALCGCRTAGGVIPINNQSSTDLESANFTVVKPGLRGEASCRWLFGLIPLDDAAIATLAMDQLVESAELAGESMGLVNFSGDQTELNLFGIYQVRTVKVRADAVKFQ